MKTQAKNYSQLYKTLIYALLALVVLIAFGVELSAQERSLDDDLNYKSTSTYKHAIGVRAGGTSGLTFKTFVSNKSAIKVIAWGNPNWLGITGLYERYIGAFDVEGMNWYYGAGAHVNYYDNDWRWVDNNFNNDVVGLGIDGIVGLEYKIPPIPIAVSVDLKPNLEAYTNGGVGFNIDPGLGIKFTI